MKVHVLNYVVNKKVVLHVTLSFVFGVLLISFMRSLGVHKNHPNWGLFQAMGQSRIAGY